jgi:hypothetical protein
MTWTYTDFSNNLFDNISRPKSEISKPQNKHTFVCKLTSKQ